MKVIGQLERAMLENSTPGALPGPVSTGRIYADVTTPAAAIPRFYDGTAWRPMVLGSGATPSPNTNINLGLLFSIASSALTATVTQSDGLTAPTALSPSTYFTRSTTATLGSYIQATLTATASVVISSGTTLGFVSSTTNWLYIYGTNAGVILASSSLYDTNTLQSYVPESAALTSISNASPAVVTLANHGLLFGDVITLTTSGSLPSGLAIATKYYLVTVATNTFRLSLTPGGSAINTTTNGSGTHTYHMASGRLVATAGVSPSLSAPIKLLGRAQFSITPGTWAAQAQLSPIVSELGVLVAVPTLQFFVSSQVTNSSSSVTSASFVTYSNSPAFTITPTISGTYKVYCGASIEADGGSTASATRVFNTSGGATLLNESQCVVYDGAASVILCSFIQSIYTLIAGTTYVFDIQAKTGSGSTILNGGNSPFCMFAERVG